MLLLASACADDVPSTTTSGDTETGSTGDASSTGAIDPDSTSGGVDPSGDSTTGGADTTMGMESETEDSTGDMPTTTGPACGDDVVEGDEECDGSELGGEDCASQGFDGGELACADDCTFDTSGCMNVNCGDDVIGGKEVCDGSDLGGQDCAAEGFDGGELGCLADCSAFDPAGCYACGDDAIAGPEICDGADLAGETCETQGFDAGTLACAVDCTGYDTTGCVNFSCGDGMVNGVEVCDGADLDGETCASQGFAGGPLGCQADCSAYDVTSCIPLPSCGDGMTNGMEVCDGADLDGETCVSQGFPGGGPLGCQADCAGYDTSMCDPGPVCGDGMVEGAENCDGLDLGGQTCVSQGFVGGVLGCDAACNLDTSMCIVGGMGDCCAPNGSPGCDDAACEAQICALDDFCCLMEWDGQCANAATGADGAGNECGVCMAPPGGDCCVANGSPGCDDAACEAQICAIDDFCCLMEWDGVCANAATGVDGMGNECGVCAPVCGDGVLSPGEDCEGADLGGETCVSQGFGGGGTLSCDAGCTFDTTMCMAGGAGDCCAANGSPGCTDIPCEGQICALDDFCCTMEWDQICADAATGADGNGNDCAICP